MAESKPFGGDYQETPQGLHAEGARILRRSFPGENSPI
jgi:hypothetical protein